MKTPPANIEDIAKQIESLDDSQKLQLLKSQFESVEDPERKRELVERVQMQIMELHHSGPLPTAQQFAAYEEVHPGTAERILRMAEQKQEFGMEIVRGYQSHRRTGLNYSFVINILVILVALLATYLGIAIIAIPLGLVGLLALILERFLSRPD